MNKVVHRESISWGRTSTIILAGGFAFVMVTVTHREPDVAVIHDLVVHESRRRKGLGRRLLKEALEEALSMGCKVSRLAVQPFTWTSEWYARSGFLPKFLVDVDGHPMSVMEKEIRSDAVEP